MTWRCSVSSAARIRLVIAYSVVARTSRLSTSAVCDRLLVGTGSLSCGPPIPRDAVIGSRLLYIGPVVNLVLGTKKILPYAWYSEDVRITALRQCGRRDSEERA